MTKTFEEEFNYLIELSGKVLIGQVDAKVFEQNRIAFFEKYETAKHQPQLTIPKSVADELDSVFAGIDATDLGYVLDQTGPYGSRAFNDYYFKNKNIIALYLAGKALGVDLVKVVEGWKKPRKISKLKNSICY